MTDDPVMCDECGLDENEVSDFWRCAECCSILCANCRSVNGLCGDCEDEQNDANPNGCAGCGGPLNESDGGCPICIGSDPELGRLTRDQLRAKYLQCVKETASLTDTKEAWIGFIVGFRCYEKMATALGKNLTQMDCDRFVPVAVKAEDK